MNHAEMLRFTRNFPHHKIALMNSAMMPQDGTYTLTSIDSAQFGLLLRAADRMGQVVSYVGYQQTADFISELAGLQIPISREQTTLADGDTMLICKLKYRIDPATKGAEVNEDDFEFFVASFSE